MELGNAEQKPIDASTPPWASNEILIVIVAILVVAIAAIIIAFKRSGKNAS
jgi:hypothetical protein